MKMDILIKNAAVFDGDAIEPQRLTVGVTGEKIVHVGAELTGSAARRVIDAAGLFLCPGFIDTHASTGFGYTLPHATDHKLYQGVTTEIIGNCGISPAPIGALHVEEIQALAQQIGFAFTWRSLAEWLEGIEQHGAAINFGTFAGHNTLRAGVVRNAEAIAEGEVEALKKLVEHSMRDGALGFSTGLVYAPGSFAETAELIACARIAAQHGGLYASHIRNEREAVEEAVEEALTIGREAGIRVLISHLKSAEKPNWGKIPKLIARIEQARKAGQQVLFEVYPYTAVSTKLSAYLPKEALDGGVQALPEKLRTSEWRNRSVHWLRSRETVFERMLLITESLPCARGKSLAELAGRTGQDPAQLAVDVLIADPAAWIVYHCLAQDDVDAAVLWPDAIVCSDSWSYPVNARNAIGHPHPRTFGAFTRFLEQYALKKQRLRFGHAIKKITSVPADFVGLPGRGRIRVGHFADLVLLDPAAVEERATFENPRQFSRGTTYLWLNGTPVIKNGRLRERRPGHVIRRAGHER